MMFQTKNVSDNEAQVSVFAGSALMFASLRWWKPFRLLMMAGGGYLLFRGITRYDPICELLDARQQQAMGTRPRQPMRSPITMADEPASDVKADQVDEAAWESFPASDPPSFTPEIGVARGGPKVTR